VPSARPLPQPKGAEVLEGKTVLVTGSGNGIGRAHARLLAALGARVVVNDLGADVRGDGKDRSSADGVVAEITDRGGIAVPDYSDVSTWSGARDAVHRGIDAFGRLDGVVNNAGPLRSGALADLDEQDLDVLIGVHLKGAFGCTVHAMRYWRERYRRGEDPRASVVNTFTDAVLISFPQHAAYAAVKAGAAQFALTASREGAEYGVRVNAYTPRGLTRQSMVTYEGLGAPIDPDVPHPKSPSNSSPLVAWLLSDESAHVSGTLFQTCGGGIARCDLWTASELVHPSGGRSRFEPDEIGDVVNRSIFGTALSEETLPALPVRMVSHAG
jgi:NAD(P)-dependent dehydrogenase (short-subunit alcohol dehydrogenase family)